MAKRRNSVFGSNLSKEQVAKEAKAIERKVMGEVPSREERPVTPPAAPKPKARKTKTISAKASPKKADKGGKRKFLYVDEPRHRAAKVKAIQLGMNMSEYIELLIDQDTK
jgi:hypothetical protein